MEKLDKQLFEREIQLLKSQGFKYRENLAQQEEGFTIHTFIDSDCDCITFTNPDEDDVVYWGFGTALLNGKIHIDGSGCDSVEHFYKVLERFFE